MKFHCVFPQIFHVTGDVHSIGKVFLRPTEYVESPQFSGKVFSLDEYIDYYKKKYGKFTYYEDYLGFNITDKNLEPFFSRKFTDISKEEAWLLKKVKGNKKFSVIGSNDKDTYLHELAHAFYYIRDDYRNAVNKELEKIDLSLLKKYLRNDGEYNDAVLDDECHAYLIAGISELEINNTSNLVNHYKNEMATMKNLFNIFKDILQ